MKILLLVLMAMTAGACASKQAAPSQSFGAFSPPSVNNTSGMNNFHAVTGLFGSPTNTNHTTFNPMALPQAWKSYSPTK